MRSEAGAPRGTGTGHLRRQRAPAFDASLRVYRYWERHFTDAQPMFSSHTDLAAICDLRKLLRAIGRSEFRAFGYAPQLRGSRAAFCAARNGAS